MALKPAATKRSSRAKLVVFAAEHQRSDFQVGMAEATKLHEGLPV
jgi:hypothetical protein